MNSQSIEQFSEAKFYSTGKELFPVLEDVISSAQKEILISLYTFSYDAIGKRFMSALCQAARRGVAVRVLIDEFGSRESSQAVKAALSDTGIAVRVFRPLGAWLLRHPLRMLCRDHARVFLVDGALFGLGGIGFGELYTEREDLFMLATVSDPQGIKSYFGELWALATHTTSQHRLPRPLHKPRPEYSLQSSGPEGFEQEIYRWFLERCRQARRRIRIVTPFFFPEHELLYALLAAKKHGVDIEVVTPLRTDKPRYDRFRAIPMPYLLDQTNAFWYGTRNYFHTKFAIIDDAWTLGSANFDIISTKRNYELNICGEGGKTLLVLEAYVARLKQNLSEITLHPAPVSIRILAALFYRVAEFFFKLT